MSTECPYNNQCPQVVGLNGELKGLTDRIEIQNKFIVEKMEDMSSDIKEIKTFLNEKLDAKIDERIDQKLNAYQAKVLRWIVATLLGSGGLSTIISLLIK